MKESLAKDIAEITIDLLNIIYLENDERSNKIKQTCAILLFALAMPNENKYEILIMSDDFPIYRAFVKTISLGDVYRIETFIKISEGSFLYFKFCVIVEVGANGYSKG